MIDHINAYALVVEDVKRCAEFYRDKLGFQLNAIDENFSYLTFGPNGSAGIALISRRGHAPELADKSRPSVGEGRSRAYFATFLEDCDTAYEELRTKGVHFVTPPTTRPDGQRYAFFEDPEGNLWEISHFPKQ
jgi:lactoylglutathione lyase